MKCVQPMNLRDLIILSLPWSIQLHSKWEFHKFTFKVKVGEEVEYMKSVLWRQISLVTTNWILACLLCSVWWKVRWKASSSSLVFLFLARFNKTYIPLSKSCLNYKIWKLTAEDMLKKDMQQRFFTALGNNLNSNSNSRTIGKSHSKLKHITTPKNSFESNLCQSKFPHFTNSVRLQHFNLLPANDLLMTTWISQGKII